MRSEHEALMAALAERDAQADTVELLAAVLAHCWMADKRLDEIRVSEEHDSVYYARDHDDVAIDLAVRHLAAGLVTNPAAPAWNPVLRLADLHSYLQDCGVLP